MLLSYCEGFGDNKEERKRKHYERKIRKFKEDRGRQARLLLQLVVELGLNSDSHVTTWLNL